MILSERDRMRVQQMLAAMSGPVRLLFFTQTLNCDTCVQARQILDELVPLSHQLAFEERNFILDKEGVETFGIERVPAIAVLAGDRDTGIRFYGIPSGYEFSSLIEAVIAASTGESDLSATSRAQLAAVSSPVRIQVFVTPT